jgi:hypothetical protein
MTASKTAIAHVAADFTFVVPTATNVPHSSLGMLPL